jgi:pyridoxal phosphate enzyme (YggS family)
MERVAENVKRVREGIRAAAGRCGRAPGSIRLVAVTKTVEIGRIRAALAAGIEEIGENYLQEALPKLAELRGHAVIRHFIGHLQRNKVARAVESFDVIQSVDDERLARAVGRQADERGRVVEVLLEVNVAGEVSKFGVDPGRALALAETVTKLEGIRLVGLMGMGPLGAGEAEARAAFRRLAALHNQLPAPQRRVLSMGMSGDYEIAIEEGSTMVRIGTGVFGVRSQP